ncbi:MAG TPA: hypothetical protein DCR55_14915 [Lentisphaeria bacterium]|jgi:hypothetical protein|nr:hypothetical protein [Lentisphaeria bacterium]
MAKEGADVRNVAELELLYLRLGQFMPDVSSVHDSVEQELLQVRGLLDQHRRKWLARTQRLRDQLAEAQLAEARVRRTQTRQDQAQAAPHTSAIQRQVIAAEKQIRATVARERMLDEVAARYRAKAHGLILRGNDLVPRARLFLNKSLHQLRGYLADGEDRAEGAVLPPVRSLLWRQSCAAMLRVAGSVEVPAGARVIVSAFGLRTEPTAAALAAAYVTRFSQRLRDKPGANRETIALVPSDHLENVRKAWRAAGGNISAVQSLALTVAEVRELTRLYRGSTERNS